jgi:uncharacterized protein (TIGR04141 family)
MARRLIRALLLEEGTSIDDAVRGPSGVPRPVRFPLRSGLPYNGELVVAQNPASRPAWVDFVAGAVSRRLSDINNQSTGACLFVQAGPRLIAFTFGRGRNLIDPGRIQDGFGLRVTLNAVDAERVRAIDSRSFEDSVILTSRQASRNLDLGSFAIDDSRDVLSAVTGVPRDPTLGSRITGSDGIALVADVEIDGLGDVAATFLDLFASDEYKANFGFIDYVRRVSSGSLVARLDAALDAELDGNLQRISLAPPERVDYEDVAGYLYPGATWP